jgi:Cu/Ag efflux pump CusA
MAVCIMFGLSFACVLTLLVMPALYSIFFDVREQSSTPVVTGTKRSLN